MRADTCRSGAEIPPEEERKRENLDYALLDPTPTRLARSILWSKASVMPFLGHAPEGEPVHYGFFPFPPLFKQLHYIFFDRKREQEFDENGFLKNES